MGSEALAGIVVSGGDATVRRALADFVRAHGYEAREVADPSDVPELATSPAPIAVLLDLSIPAGVGGVDVVRRVRAVSGASRIVLHVDDEQEATGADTVLVRPSRPSAILDALVRPRAIPERLCVFVVEDHQDTLDGLVEALAIDGIHAFGFTTAESALATLRGIRPDAIVTDYLLPDLTGAELARRARAAGGPLPVIALTGWSRLGADASTFDRVLTKPADLLDVVEAVRALAAPRRT